MNISGTNFVLASPTMSSVFETNSFMGAYMANSTFGNSTFGNMTFINSTFASNSTGNSSASKGPPSPPKPITCVDLHHMCNAAMRAIQLSMIVSNITSNNTNCTNGNTNCTYYSTMAPNTTPSNGTSKPKAPPGDPPVCVFFRSKCVANIHIRRLTMAMGCFGGAAALLNSFVIGRIIYSNFKVRIHQSKLYFLSMAFADAYFGLTCFIYMLMLFRVIHLPRTHEAINTFKLWFNTSIYLSFNSSLFHVVMITIDRFMATRFPLIHKIHINKKKVLFFIFILWVLSVIVALMPKWTGSPDFSTWFVALVGTLGSLLLIITYLHISRVALKRKKTLKQLSKNKADNSQSKSINTTFLSISITVTFILCNSFMSIYSFMYLFTKNFVHVPEVGYIEYLLLNINCAVNPVLYTIVEFFHSKVYRNRRRSSVTQNTDYRSRKSTVGQGSLADPTVSKSNYSVDDKSNYSVDDTNSKSNHSIDTVDTQI